MELNKKLIFKRFKHEGYNTMVSMSVYLNKNLPALNRIEQFNDAIFSYKRYLEYKFLIKCNRKKSKLEFIKSRIYINEYSSRKNIFNETIL